MENMNKEEDLNKHLTMLLDGLDKLEAVPGLQIESSVGRKTPDQVKFEEGEEGDPDKHDEVVKKEIQGEFA